MAHLKGYHHLVLPDGSRHDWVVVEFDDQGRYLSHHPLRSEVTGSAASFIEEPFVEWVGGTVEIEDWRLKIED